MAGMRSELFDVGLSVEPFVPEQAEQSAQLWKQSNQYGLSLADRACLSLAMDKSLPVLTADKAWKELDLGVEIQLLR